MIVPQEPYIILKLPPAIKHHNFNGTRQKQQSKSCVSHARFRVTMLPKKWQNEERQKGVKLPKKSAFELHTR